MKVLSHRKIGQKITRMAIEIIENNYDEKEIILAGINNNGSAFAQLLLKELSKIDEKKIFTLAQIRLDPANPIHQKISISLSDEEMNGKTIIIVDDVANSGRTIFYACKPIFNIVPKKIEAAVLVDRTHKSYPIKVDYIGLALATTLKENIRVNLSEPNNFAVFLE